LAVFGVVFEGVRLIFVGYESVNLSMAPGVSVGEYGGMGSNIWATSGVYTPTLIEVAISAGLIALGALIVTIGLAYLPIQHRPSAVRADGGSEE
ncbi:MAG: molybdopterin oxidoreductase, partial [Halanaeroarchaeum sp.]